MAEKNSIPQFVNSESIMSDSNYVKWLSDLKGRIRIAQLKAAIKVNEELHKLYWSLGEDICNKQKLYKWGTNFIKQLSLDLRSAFPNVEGFSWSNLYKIRKWYLFYSSQNEFLYQAGTKLRKVDNAACIEQICLSLHHSNVKERTDAKQGKLGCFAPDIYDVSKL